MELAHQLVQGHRPVDLQLGIEQGLSALEVVEGHEGVVLLEVADPRGIELPRQPVAAVEDDLDLERQPGLQPHVHRAEDGVIQIEISEVNSTMFLQHKLFLQRYLSEMSNVCMAVGSLAQLIPARLGRSLALT